MEMRRVYFARWHEASQLPKEWWEQQCDLLQEKEYEALLGSLVEDQAAATRRGEDAFIDLCGAITGDIIDLRLLSGFDRTELRYLQFESSITPLRHSIQTGNFSRAHDWIINGLANEISALKQREFCGEKIDEFDKSACQWVKSNFEINVIDWASCFYYYCRARSVLYTSAFALVNTVLDALRRADLTDPKTIETHIAVLDWTICHQTPQAGPLTAALEYLFNLPDQPLANRAEIAICLGCTAASQYSSRPQKYWAAWAISKAEKELRCHEPLQAAIAMIDSQKDWNTWKPYVKAAIKFYRKTLNLDFRHPVSGFQSLDQRVQLLNRLVFNLHAWGLDADTRELFVTWYGAHPALLTPLLLIMPNHGEGMASLGAKPDLITSPDWPARIDKLNEITNRALGVFLTIQGQATTEYAPDAPGEPDYTLGPEFERQVHDHYQFHAIAPEAYAEACSMVSFPSYPHPLQPLMRRDLGFTLPIASSLEACESDRHIRTVGFWFAGNDYYSEMEAVAVCDIFQRKNIKCEVFSGAQMTTDEFFAFYQRTDLDVLWVAGHGIYDHWDPHAASILAGENCRVDIASLYHARPKGPGRRLLVLNICDGGVAAVMGSLHRLGMAPMLACSEQATISHMWPVEPRLAGAFGVHLAKNLSNNSGYFQSFCGAMDAMRMRMSEIAESCRQITQGEMTDRIANFEVDNSNIFHWGSPCFFQ